MHPVPFPEASGVLPCTPRRGPPASGSMGTGGVVGIVVRDASLDGGDARVEGVEDRILQPLPGQPREEPLDGVRPGRRGRGEAERPVEPALRPRADPGRPVRRNAVGDDVHRGSGCDPLGDRVGEGEELLRAVPVDPTLPVATSRAASRQVVRPCPGVTGRGLLRPPERLYLRLLVHRKDDGMVGRVDTEADDIAGHPEGPDPVRPEAVLLQDAVQTIPGFSAGTRPSASTFPSAAWSRPARSPSRVLGRCGHASAREDCAVSAILAATKIAWNRFTWSSRDLRLVLGGCILTESGRFILG